MVTHRRSSRKGKVKFYKEFYERGRHLIFCAAKPGASVRGEAAGEDRPQHQDYRGGLRGFRSARRTEHRPAQAQDPHPDRLLQVSRSVSIADKKTYIFYSQAIDVLT
jgi:hypothetical protein